MAPTPMDSKDVFKKVVKVKVNVFAGLVQRSPALGPIFWKPLATQEPEICLETHRAVEESMEASSSFHSIGAFWFCSAIPLVL